MKSDAVEWKKIPLNKIIDYEQPNKYIVNNEIISDSNYIPVLTANNSFILGYTKEKSGIFGNVPVIIFDDFTTNSKLVDFKFKVKSSALKILKPKTKEINIKYVFYMMKSIKINFSTHKRYYLSEYQNKEIIMPFINGEISFYEQKKIVNEIEKLEKLKEKREQNIQKCDELIKSIFYDMFGGPVKKNNMFIKKSIGDVCSTISGGTPNRSKKEYYNGNISWVKSGELNQGYIYATEEHITELGMNNSSAKLIPKDTILLAMYGATAGKVGFLKINATTNQAVCAIIPNNEINNIYLYYYLKSIEQDFIDASFGGGQSNISQQLIKKTKIMIPPLVLQNKFAKKVEVIEKLKEKQIKSKEEIGNLFNGLMQKYFNGD